jgi:hypothetical protein
MLTNWWINKANVVYLYNGVLLSHKEEWNDIIYKKMYRNDDHYIEWNKPISERQILHVFSQMWTIDLKTNII